MSGPFDPPPGDAASVQAAAASLGRMATDLNTQLTKATLAVPLTKSEWKGSRADDFAHAGQALLDELTLMVTATGNAANILGNYATELQNVTADIAGYKTQYDAVKDPTGADPSGSEALSAGRQRSNWIQQATNARSALHTYALRTVSALDTETSLAVPKASTLTPAEIGRKVDFAMGFTGMDEANFMLGKVDDDAAWAMLGLAYDPVFDTGVPVPGDPGFQAWYAALTPAQQLLETQKLNASVNIKGFDPYKTVQPGALPQWAVQFNAQHQNTCNVDGSNGDGYGYFGGGTIRGPGGKQWPIVMPYYSDGKYTYMDDDGQTRTDGGINQLDGNDPGWHDVYTYTGAGSFGKITGTTRLATVFLIGSGQDVQVKPLDPDAVRVGKNGVPYAGGDIAEYPEGPPDKAWWDVDSDAMMPKPLENPVKGAIEPNLEYNAPALGANTLAVQAGQAAVASQELDSHTQRQWYIDYQVNDDGRTRAVVRTYTAGRTEDGKTGVVGLANSFPTGQSGNTNEVPYKTRFNPYSQTVATAAPDPNVDYSNKDDDLPPGLGPGGYISEPLNK